MFDLYKHHTKVVMVFLTILTMYTFTTPVMATPTGLNQPYRTQQTSTVMLGLLPEFLWNTEDGQGLLNQAWDKIKDGASYAKGGFLGGCSWVGTLISEGSFEKANQAFSNSYSKCVEGRREDRLKEARTKGGQAAKNDWGAVGEVISDFGGESEDFVTGPWGYIIGGVLILIIIIFLLLRGKKSTVSKDLDEGYVDGVRVYNTDTQSLDMLADKQGIDVEDISATKF